MSESSITSGFTKASPAVLKDETKKYFKFIDVILVLTAITFVELILIILPFVHELKFVALIILSAIKFLAVIWYFMHLRWDRFLLTLLFVGGMVLAGGTVYALIHLFEAPPLEAKAEVQ
ncbi:MAG: cytochrome C oxidase subunit IV family protein [Verrucomicrobiota bacterium]|nr:cytochrome C oxidase subunit IV family protein [Verrucomicrobiota bacterium]